MSVSVSCRNLCRYSRKKTMKSNIQVKMHWYYWCRWAVPPTKWPRKSWSTRYTWEYRANWWDRGNHASELEVGQKWWFQHPLTKTDYGRLDTVCHHFSSQLQTHFADDTHSAAIENRVPICLGHLAVQTNSVNIEWLRILAENLKMTAKYGKCGRSKRRGGSKLTWLQKRRNI